jgi:hypothetical protein
MGQDCTVGIATRYGLNGQDIESQWGGMGGWVGKRFFAPVQPDSGAHPASYTTGTGSFPGGKRQGVSR